MPAGSILFLGRPDEVPFADYSVKTASSPEEAVELLKTSNYDLIVADIAFGNSTVFPLEEYVAANKETVVVVSHHASKWPGPSPSEPSQPSQSSAPRLGERILLLILSKEERLNIIGDLTEEYAEIATKHGERFARIWYYKQVATSAWPMIRKAIRWGVLASLGAWIRRFI